MRAVRTWFRRLFGGFGAADADRELAAELESHLQLHIDDNLRAGLPPNEARRRALLALGGIDQAKELYRDRRTLPALEVFGRDLRDAWRRLKRTPGAALAIVVTLAAALGLNAAVFAMADALVLRPFPVRNVHELVSIEETRPEGPYRGFTSAANFVEWKRSTTAFRHLIGWTLRQAEFSGHGEPERLQAVAVTANFFESLGVRLARGRDFIEDDEIFGRHRQVILSDALWIRRFAADPAIVGQTIQLDDVPHEIVGVGAAAFDFPFGADLWLPLAFDASNISNRNQRFVLGFGRLKEGVTLEAAQSQLRGVGDELARRYPDANVGRPPRVQPFVVGFGEPELGILFSLLQGCALLVLLVACANITNLLLALGADRQKEVAVRCALGATRAQVIRSLWFESGILGIASIPVALGIAAAAIAVLKALMPPRFDRLLVGWRSFDLDARVVLVTAAAALMAAVLFGLMSAIQTTRPDANALKESARGLSAGGRRLRLRRGLIVAQVALVLPLLMAAAATWRGTTRFLNGPQGYDTAGVLTFRLSLPERRYVDVDALRRFTTSVTERLLTLDEVEAAAIANVLPSSLEADEREIVVEGQPPLSAGQRNPVEHRVVTPGYFETLRLPILAGRGFFPEDRAGSERVAIVSRSMADRYWPAVEPLGRRFRYQSRPPATPGPWIVVVGVSGDVIHDWAFSRNAPTVYLPYAQQPIRELIVALRTSNDPAAAAGAVHRVVHAEDAGRPLFDVRSMREIVSERLTAPLQVSVMMATLSGLGLTLAAIGLYGVIAYAVAQRTHEIGLRLALGATRRDVITLVLGQAARLTIGGVVVGSLFALASSRILEATLYGIAAFDPSLLFWLSMFVAVTGLAAAYVPARRALAIEPAVALRHE